MQVCTADVHTVRLYLGILCGMSAPDRAEDPVAPDNTDLTDMEEAYRKVRESEEEQPAAVADCEQQPAKVKTPTPLIS